VDRWSQEPPRKEREREGWERGGWRCGVFYVEKEKVGRGEEFDCSSLGYGLLLSILLIDLLSNYLID
jgi:hypothetical protein